MALGRGLPDTMPVQPHKHSPFVFLLPLKMVFGDGHLVYLPPNSLNLVVQDKRPLFSTAFEVPPKLDNSSRSQFGTVTRGSRWSVGGRNLIESVVRPSFLHTMGDSMLQTEERDRAGRRLRPFEPVWLGWWRERTQWQSGPGIWVVVSPGCNIIRGIRIEQ